MDAPKPPRGLSRKACRIWREITRQYVLDARGLLLLQSALEAFDRVQECRKVVRQEGLQVVDPSGRTRAHPLLAVERDARQAMHRALRELPLPKESESWIESLFTNAEDGP